MLHYGLAHWLEFFTAALLLNLAPGPDLAFILGHTLKSGRRQGFMAMLGIWTGACCHATLAALGLSAIVAASAEAFALVKWAGAFYLLWLGWKAIRTKESTFAITEPVSAQALGKVFGQGMLVNLLNPKVAIFFLAFLPQFAVHDQGPLWLQLSVHGFLIIGVAAFIEPPLVLLGHRVGRYLRSDPRLGLWLDRSLGGILIGLGLTLAASKR